MKCAVLSFLFLLSSISLAFSQERTSLIIQKNTEVSLSSLLSPILDSKTGAETVFISQLYLGEGAKLYINRPITIDAKKIILKPKSTVHTLGNSLTIKTEVFDALNFQPPSLNLSEDQRKELMGRIDTRHKEEKHHGKDGQAGQGGLKGENARFYQGYPPRTDDAQVGNPPEEKGEDGTPGRNAGSMTLYVRKFLGGYFDTRGGNGGRGGRGGKGGDGGNGLSIQNYDKNDEIRSIDGARGGEGGRGGNGGSGGKGGTISIMYETEDLSSEKTLFILNEGGKGGEGGERGMAGDGGLGGKSSRHYEDRTGQEIISWYEGKNGAQGPFGAQGDRGTDGVQGARQVQKYDSQN